MAGAGPELSDLTHSGALLVGVVLGAALALAIMRAVFGGGRRRGRRDDDGA